MDGSLHLLSDLYPRFMFFCLFKRTNMLCDGPTILHFPKTIVFAFLLSLLSIQFPTCSQIYIKFISDPMAGFAFVYMEDERDEEDAIRRLDRIEFGRKGRRLRVERTKHERGGRKPDRSRRSSANTRPTKTLFIINFDPINTRTTDLERHFESFGKISNVRIRRNFAFVQFELQEDATRALEATDNSEFMDRVISVEYSIRDDDDRGNGHSPDRRGRDASPNRRGYGAGRSRSPYRKDRSSPDYGHGSVLDSRSKLSPSPDYRRSGSTANERYNSRSSSPRERFRS
ncbi:serine/arginine-rich splicing factor RS40-like isoform X2 [Olea europaea var. sylvestris]|uniref:serine/arginine-rich splicing factor RS40-like isoform X2 n=2 Tax=Olea europaea var. sylvestris TaxID=158386 RepID=UPI000C1D2F9C|nr:serine/arginine-rich splicing factor RS40-like isoform X2 [Olea europaea var. sylvestris]